MKEDKKIRIALCLHGLSGGKNSKGRIVQTMRGYETINNYILSKYDVDVFMHSWTMSSEKRMVDLYHPKKYLFEPQISFEGPTKYKFSSNFYKNMKSLYYSYQKVNQLKKSWEKENDFIYDYVIHSRFDMYITRMKPNVIKELDPTKIYFLGYNKKKLLDHFWLGSSDIMDKFIDLFDKIPDLEEDLKKIGSNNQYLNHDIIYLNAKKEGIDNQLTNLSGSLKGGTYPFRFQKKTDIF